MKNSLRFSLLIASLFVMGGFGILRANAAWQGPTDNPPGGNVAAPINVSNVNQWKEGGLTIGGVVFGDDFTVKAGGDLTIDTDKFTVVASTGNTTIAGNLTVGGLLTAANVSIGNLTINDLTVNDTFTVKDSTNADLFKVDGLVGQDEVRVGADATTSGIFQVQSEKDNVPAIVGIKKSPWKGWSMVARNSDISNAALYAKNDLGSGIFAESDVATYGAIVGKSTQGAANLAVPKNYSAGVRGESAIDANGVEAISGVLGVGSDLTNYANNDVRSFGVVGAGGDISTPVAGGSTRLTSGVYGKAGTITSGVPQAITYGIFGESGSVVGGSGTSWAGYFQGKVNITDELKTTTITNSGAISTQSLSAETVAATVESGTPLSVEKTNGDDLIPAAVITDPNNGTTSFGGTTPRYSWMLKISEPQEPSYTERQIVFSDEDDAFFAYNPVDQCVELWVPNTAGNGDAPSFIGGQWGGSCQDACGNPTGECKQLSRTQPSCASFGMEPYNAKCLRSSVPEIAYTCCKQDL